MKLARVTLYTKPECGLCEDVHDVIKHVARRRAFELEVRNILERFEDYERYKHDIPVVLVEGKEIARHRMTEEQFEAALTGRA
jgi:hypothetical protein